MLSTSNWSDGMTSYGVKKIETYPGQVSGLAPGSSRLLGAARW
jgi:hypothetical protein